MHDEIIRYQLEGEIADGNIVKSRERLIQSVESQMRDEGCAPNLDLEPQFTLDYQPDSGTFRFSLSVYGVYIGEESWTTAGITAGTKVMRHTQRIKSQGSSSTVE